MVLGIKCIAIILGKIIQKFSLFSAKKLNTTEIKSVITIYNNPHDGGYIAKSCLDNSTYTVYWYESQDEMTVNYFPVSDDQFKSVFTLIKSGEFGEKELKVLMAEKVVYVETGVYGSWVKGPLLLQGRPW